MLAQSAEMSEVGPAARKPGAFSSAGALSLLAVVAVLVVVSVPRLRGLAVQENEVDARATALILARALQGLEGRPARKPALRDILRRPELRGLADVELLVEGSVLRRHGYLFEITRLSPAMTAPAAPAALLCGEPPPLAGMLAIRAWPWAHGATGEAAFLVTQKGGRLVHANSARSWEGLEAAGARLCSLEGWRPGS